MQRSLVNWCALWSTATRWTGRARLPWAGTLLLGVLLASLLLGATSAPTGSLSYRAEWFRQVGGPLGSTVFFDDFADGLEPPHGPLGSATYFVGCPMASGAESAGVLVLDNSSLCVDGEDAFIDVILSGGSFDIQEGVGGLAEARFTFTAPMEPNSGFGVELFSDQNGVSAMVQAAADGRIVAQVEPEGDRTGVIGSEEDITALMAGVTDVTVRLDASSGTHAVAALDFGSDGTFDLTLAGIATLANSTAYTGGVIADTCAVWCDEGQGLAGVSGVPELDGEGPLETGTPGLLALSSAAPAKPAVLFVSFIGTGAPFKCGTLIPVPTASQYSLFTNSGGGLTIPWASWPGSLSGVSIYFQYAIKDAAAVCGASLSNALRADVP